MILKGYPGQTKDDRTKSEAVTVTPAGEYNHALSVKDVSTVSSVATDAVEANSTTSVINATAHVAKKGDRIRITSGTHSGAEVDVIAVDTNTITIAQTLSSAPATGVTFSILRPTSLTVSASGGLTISGTGPVQYKLNGVDTDVAEDTGTPANNRPLPVKLVDASGSVTITAANLDVQLTHAGASPDSVRIGDGTETVSVTASNQMEVAVTAALPAGTNNIGDVDVLTQPARSHSTDSIKIGDGTDFLAISGTGEANVIVTSALPSGTNAIGKLSANDGVDIGDTTINNGSGASAVNIQDGGNSITVDGTLAVTQSGTWNINDISGTISLPTGASTLAEQQTQTTSLQLIDDSVATTGAAITAKGIAAVGTDGTNARILKTDASGELQVDILSQPALSHSTDSVKLGDGTEFASITASNQLEVAVTASLPAGTNAIGKLSANDGVDIGDVTINNAGGASAVNIQDGGNSITVDGTVAATQSGTWNINDVTGTVSLPTGAATLAEQQTQTTSLQLLDDVVATTGAAITAKGYAVSGTDGTNARVLKTDASGELQVDVLSQPALSHSTDSVRIGDGTDLVSITAANQMEVAVTAALPSGTNNIGDVDVLSEQATAADGGGLPSVCKVVAGYDGSNVQVLSTNASGRLQVDIVSGGSSGVQYTEGDTDASITGNAIMWEDAADTLVAVSAAKPLPISDAGGSLTVDGTVAATQSGTWNINNVSGTVSLPTGASTLAEQQTQTTSLQLIDDAVATTGSAITAKGIAASGTDGTDARILRVDTDGHLQVDVLTGGGGGTQYTEGDVDASITGTAILWEDSGDTLRAVSAAKPLPIGDAGGSLTVDGTVTIQDGGNVISVDDAGSTLSIDDGGGSITVDGTVTATVASLNIVDLFDTPVLDASSTNINGSAGAFVQVVASTAADIKKIQILDTTGGFIGLYTGAAASEVLKLVIGPGSDQTIEATIPSGTRLSVRRLESTTALTSGHLSMNFMG